MNYLTIIHILLGCMGCVLSYTIGLSLFDQYEALFSNLEYLRLLNVCLILCTSYVSISVAAKSTRYKSKTTSWIFNILASIFITTAMILSVSYELLPTVLFDNQVIVALIILSMGVWVKILVSIYAFFKFKHNKKDKSREYGVIKWFNPVKGFGFITRNQGEDLFVHYRAFVNSKYANPKEGQQVHFLVNKGYKGLQAYSVRIISIQ